MKINSRDLFPFLLFLPVAALSFYLIYEGKNSFDNQLLYTLGRQASQLYCGAWMFLSRRRDVPAHLRHQVKLQRGLGLAMVILCALEIGLAAYHQFL